LTGAQNHEPSEVVEVTHCLNLHEDPKLATVSDLLLRN